MCEGCWKSALKRTLESLRTSERILRVAVVGIGQELRGDDGAGMVVANSLTQHFEDHPCVLIVNGGCAPENHTGSLRCFRPDFVLLIDAAALEGAPGTVYWLDPQQTTGLSASTHTMPLHLLATYLQMQLGCTVVLIGIQPEQTALGAGLSPTVSTAIDEVIDVLVETLRPRS
jgi:hydrogenase 3 maturation protease